jgi:hypothetical protein
MSNAWMGEEGKREHRARDGQTHRQTNRDGREREMKEGREGGGSSKERGREEPIDG